MDTLESEVTNTTTNFCNGTEIISVGFIVGGSVSTGAIGLSVDVGLGVAGTTGGRELATGFTVVGLNVGNIVGDAFVGDAVGVSVGIEVVGAVVGLAVGEDEGDDVGLDVGLDDGFFVGFVVGFAIDFKARTPPLERNVRDELPCFTELIVTSRDEFLIGSAPHNIIHQIHDTANRIEKLRHNFDIFNYFSRSSISAILESNTLIIVSASFDSH